MSSRGHVDRAGAPARPPIPSAPEEEVDALVRRLRERVEAADPATTRCWWTALSQVERQALIIDSPALVGAAAGVPARQRDEANRLHMLSDLDLWGDADQDGALTPSERDLLAATRETQRHAEEAPPGVPLLVLLYRADPMCGRAEVALCLDDPDTTEEVVAVAAPQVGGGIGWDLAALAAVRERAVVPTAVVGWRGSAVALHALLAGLRAGRRVPHRIGNSSNRPLPM